MKYYLLGVVVGQHPVPSAIVFGSLGLVWFLGTSSERGMRKRIRNHYKEE